MVLIAGGMWLAAWRWGPGPEARAYADANAGWGEVALADGDGVAALAAYEAAAALQPDDPEAQIMLGIIYEETDREAEAAGGPGSRPGGRPRPGRLPGAAGPGLPAGRAVRACLGDGRRRHRRPRRRGGGGVSGARRRGRGDGARRRRPGRLWTRRRPWPRPPARPSLFAMARTRYAPWCCNVSWAPPGAP